MDEIFTLNELKEEVYKCSKCALCKQICPVYQKSKNEMHLAKGRCIILNEIFNQNLKINVKILKTFDDCIGCNKCKDYCPSSIDMEKIAKTLYRSYYNTHLIRKAFDNSLYKFSKGKFGRKLD